MSDQEIRNRIVEKLLRNRVVGSHKKRIETVTSNYLPSHQEGRGKEVINDMLTDPGSPIESYGGGHRKNIRLKSVEDAVEYLKENDGNVPFGFD